MTYKTSVVSNRSTSARGIRLQRLWRSARQNPTYVGMRALARFSFVRRTVSRLHALVHRSNAKVYECEAKAALSSARIDFCPELGTNHGEFVQRLREDGVGLGLRLRDEDVQAIRSYAQVHPCYADRDVTSGFFTDQHTQACKALDKQVLIAQYFNVGTECETIKRLIQDPLLRLIACKYLESKPLFVGANLWWTYPVQPSEADRTKHAHLFHCDVDDFRFLKFFFYLTDVLPGDGAHVCVRASHEDRSQFKGLDRWMLRRYSDEEIHQMYSSQSIMEITGAAGTGFAENTLCIHKGLTPHRTPRLLLQIQFALFDYGAMHDRRSSESLKLLDV